jgi:hypothetical protein
VSEGDLHNFAIKINVEVKIGKLVVIMLYQAPSSIASALLPMRENTKGMDTM